MTGSSPHTRGAPWSAPSLRCGFRIIPAYAGSTRDRRPLSRQVRDHPRIRGEHALRAGHGMVDRGSSPHTRGAQAGGHLGEHVRGIIPAYAGSTRGSSTRADGWRDHPRIRGEHGVGEGASECLPGSSPHTRGAPRLAQARLRRRRIIPAYAGSTSVYSATVKLSSDHPRIRGEHFSWVPISVAISGSSPHTRGAPERTAGPGCRRRIIPAYAGSTGRACRISRQGPDHPRIRGEHLYGAGRLVIGGGSSPHTRGALEGHDHRRAAEGIIPAYAGSTLVGRAGPGRLSDHPRIRGEHVEAYW